MRIFLSGPMTGLPDFNYPNFNNTAAILRSHGHTVLNPAENCNGRKDLEHSEYLKYSLSQVVCAEAIAMLPGWEISKGATLELSVAQAIGLKAYEVQFAGYLTPLGEPIGTLTCPTHGMPMKETPYGTDTCAPAPDILDEARSIVHGPREDDYGDKETNMQRIADLWNGYLGYDEHPHTITVIDVAQMMILVKVARNRHKPGRDSNVDIAGYTLIAQELMQ